VTGAGSLVRTASQWTIGFILTLVLIAFLLALAAAQITSSGPAHRVLRRAVAVTTDIDSAIPGIQERLRQAAAEGSSGDVAVPGYPIPVEVPRTQAQSIDPAGLRRLILDESARRLYSDGWSVWDDSDPEARQDVRRISSAGLLKTGLGLINDGNHRIFLGLAGLLGLMALGLALALAVSLAPLPRLAALGGVLTAAGLPLLAGAVAIRFGLRTAAVDADPFAKGLLDLGVDIMAVPIRTYLIVSLLGMVMALLGGGAMWWQARSGREAAAAGPMP